MSSADPKAPSVTQRASGVPPVGASPSDMLLVTGRGQLRPFRILGPELVIGRERGCDVVIDHPMLSRQHACLSLGPPLTVRDLGSTNGTRVAGNLLKGGAAVRLGDGESFGIGPFAFLLLRGGDAASSAGIAGKELLRVEDPTLEHGSGLLREIATSAATIVILGETGVGKELLAEGLHRLSGRRGPLVRINCAALSESLLESELFGHEKGAFTGAGQARAGLLESAQTGTVFLDEVGDMPLGIQAKLLRALEAREVQRLGSTRPIAIDVRFVAATNRNLIAEVAAGRFRQDLYFRLDGVSLLVPPLRERRSMIVPLALRFLAAARPGEAGTLGVAAELVTQLEGHDWPGNVRELKAVIERAALLARGGEIRTVHVVLAPPTQAEDRPVPAARPAPVTVPAPVSAGAADPALAGLSKTERIDRARILEVLEQCAGNQTRAARALGISRTTLAVRLQLYRIPRPRVG